MAQTMAAYILLGAFLTPLGYAAYIFYCMEHNKQPKCEWSHVVYAVVLLASVSILIKDLF